MEPPMNRLSLAAVCATGLCVSSCASEATVEAISQPHWAERGPSVRDYLTAFPQGAYRRDIEGRASLICLILSDRTLDCRVDRESPPGLGFGAAAMTLSRAYVVRTVAEDPRLAPGSQIRVPFKFAIPP
jgi:protein TonB